MIDLELVSRERLMAFNEAIAQWERLSGTPAELESARYIEAQLAAMGFASRILMHDAYISLPGRASLEIESPSRQSLECITHSMAIPTGPDGVTSELIFLGKGASAAEWAAARGKVALLEGRATPDYARTATAAGLLGIVCISGRHAHEMCCSPVWGNPSETTVDQLPKVHILSVHRKDGEGLRELCQKGPVTIRYSAEVQTGWTKTPIVVADLKALHPEAEANKYVLYSGHLDSWYVGAMDNASANAGMLEVARLMAPRQKEMRRSLKLAFWSGHSHGRYSSSAWYSDEYWMDLNDNCVLHVNTDSTGGIDHDDFKTNAMAETFGLAERAVRDVAGAPLEMKRVARNSDQSFVGVGIASVLGSVSRSMKDEPELGWWWHTPHDTMDKIDPDRNVRDTQIFVHSIYNAVTALVLPLDYAASAADIAAALKEIGAQAGSAFNLSAAVEAANALQTACARLNQAAAQVTSAQRAAGVNEALQRLGRILIPATYTAAGRFRHDPALDGGFLPRLQRARRLSKLAAGSDEARLLLVDLVQARNELLYALRESRQVVESQLTS